MPADRPDLLIIGGSGLLGRAIGRVAPRATDATHWSNSPGADAIAWHRIDLSDGGARAADLLRERRPRSVINAAYVQGGDTLDPVTRRTPGELAVACAEIGARFVHVSTDVVFDGRTDRPYREDDPTSPMHDYGAAKADAEAAVADADPSAVIVRTSLLYGDADDPGPQVRMTTDPDVTFFDDETRNPIAVRSLASACVELATDPDLADLTGLLHVAGADLVDRFTFARLVAPLVGVDPASINGAPGPPSDTRPKRCPLDSSLARSRLRTPLPGVFEVLG